MTDDSANKTSSGSDVFVSYASQDATVANSIVENLESHGLKCWIAPRDVKPGAQYADAIVRAINEAKAVVLVMSGSAVGSPHVGKEIERGSSKRKPIIAFRIDAAPLNHALEYFLSESQWIDVPNLGMPAALAKLAEAVGHVSMTSPPAVPSPRSSVRKRAVIVAAAVIGVGAAVAIGIHFWPTGHGGLQAPAVAAITDKSIAVLPFTDMSEKKDQEYFADGMAEEIIDLLVKIPGLKVISRTSSFQFKGKTQDLRSIGAELGVAYVLQGSVRKSGDRLRVTAQLINSRDGAQLWSQTYDRNLIDVLKMQDEIALALVQALQIEVGAVPGMVSRPALRNTEAYAVYLQGLHNIAANQQSFEKALRDFQRALDLDPSFADAAAGIGVEYLSLGMFGFMPPNVAFEKSRAATELALKLDLNLATAHATLGTIHDIYDGDLAAADREMKLARALAPNDAAVLFTSSMVSGHMGHSDEALKFLTASMERNPLFAGTYLVLGIGQLGAGRLSEAETSLRRVLELDASSVYGHYLLGNVLLARRQPEAALAEYSKETLDAVRIGGTAMAYFATGRKSDSDAALAQMVGGMTDHPFAIAEVYAFRGETDEALKWLERAHAQKDRGLILIHNPAFKTLEGDARYKAFLPKIKSPE